MPGLLQAEEPQSAVIWPFVQIHQTAAGEQAAAAADAAVAVAVAVVVPAAAAVLLAEAAAAWPAEAAASAAAAVAALQAAVQRFAAVKGLGAGASETLASLEWRTRFWFGWAAVPAAWSSLATHPLVCRQTPAPLASYVIG